MNSVHNDVDWAVKDEENSEDKEIDGKEASEDNHDNRPDMDDRFW